MKLRYALSREVRIHACKVELLRPVPPGTALVIPDGCTGADMAEASNELANMPLVADDHVEYAPANKLTTTRIYLCMGFVCLVAGATMIGYGVMLWKAAKWCVS